MTTTDRPTVWVALDETDGVEVLEALSVAAKVHDVCGDTITANHYRAVRESLLTSVSAIANNPLHPLIAAYHALFDVKDGAERGSALFDETYRAIGALEIVMNNLGVTIPRRYDAVR